jgi:RHS repeat-associated protein
MPSGTPNQTTQYNYGVTTGSAGMNTTNGTTGGTTVNSNDLLASVWFPDASSGSASNASAQFYSYNAQGQALTYNDQNNTQHVYIYDILGRKTKDAVTLASGSAVDGTIMAQGISFDTGGRPNALTSYNSTSATADSNILNQVLETYNGLGQLTGEYQEHRATYEASASSSLGVQYGHTEMASGLNNSRIVSITYPNSRVLTYDYGTPGGLDDSVSRVVKLMDGSTTDVSYKYLGVGTVIQKSYNGPGITLDLWGGTSGTYAGLDNLGRVTDQKWTGPSSAITDEFQYSYDRDSNVLYKNNAKINSLSELYHAGSSATGDNATAYDHLNRPVGFNRGSLSASGNNGSGVLDSIGTASSLASHSESWSLDTLGNWSNLATDGTSAVTRSHNSKNELTGITGGSTSSLFDANGNMTRDPDGHTYIYDAWNHLISVSSGGTTLASYAYDAHGWRIKETHGSITTDLYYSHNWQVIEEKQGSTTTAQYTWSLEYVDGLAFRDDSTSLTRRMYAQQDVNWNTTALVDTSGTVQERYVYDPYGKVTVLDSSGAQRGDGSASASSYGWGYLHQGGRLDTTTRLSVFRHRDYSAALGRWMEPDPLGYFDGLSLYAYEIGNPGSALDPAGLGTKTDIAVGAASLIPGVGNYIAASSDFGHGHWGWGLLDIGCIALDECGIGEGEAATRTGVILAEDAAKARAAAKAAEEAKALEQAAKAAEDAKKVEQAAKDAEAAKNAKSCPNDLGPHAPGDVPNNQVVVKGGTKPPDAGTQYSGSQGQTLGDASAGVPHNQVQPTTAGDIRNNGGTVDVAPELSKGGNMNYQHVNVTDGPDGSTLGSPQPNPVPQDRRIDGPNYTGGYDDGGD